MGKLQTMLKKLEAEYSLKNIFTIMCANGKETAAEYMLNDKIIGITYEQYETYIRAAATRVKQNIRRPKGEFVGLKMENDPLWPVAFWGLLMAGFQPVLIDYKSNEQATLHVLKQTGAKALITDLEMELSGIAVIKPENIVAYRYEDVELDNMEDFADHIGLCTSGTTATAKVYVYDGKAIGNQIYFAKGIIAKNKDIMPEGHVRSLAFLPFHHIFGFIAVYLWYSFFGKTIIYLQDRTPQTILATCQKHKVTHIYSVPLFWNNVAKGVLRKAKLKGEKTYELLIKLTQNSTVITKKLLKGVRKSLAGNHVRFCISGGGHIPEETLRLINGIGYHLVTGYGMTETGVNCVELSRNQKVILAGSIGEPFEPMEFTLRGNQNDEHLGELFIRGKALHIGQMVGGVMIPCQVDSDGWFATGDIAREKNGHYFMEGRSKDVIINESGENIYPDELEDYFGKIDAANHVCIVGIKGEGLYEDITLIIDPGENPSKETLDEMCTLVCQTNSLLPIYKKLNRALISKKPLPLANGIKVQRQKMKKYLEEGSWDYWEINLKAKKLSDQDQVLGQVPENIQSGESQLGVNEQMKESVRQIFAQVLSLKPQEIDDDANFIDDLGGDSLSSLGVFNKIEHEFGIRISEEEYFTCSSVRETAALIESKLGELKPKKPAGKVEKITSMEGSREYLSYRKALDDDMLFHVETPYEVEGNSVIIDTKEVDATRVVNLASIDYFQSAISKEIIATVKDGLDQYGLANDTRNAKLLSAKADHQMADYLMYKNGVFMHDGVYQDLTFLSCLLNDKDALLYDSMLDVRMEHAAKKQVKNCYSFSHNNFEVLKNLLGENRNRYEKILVYVQGLYPEMGDGAKLGELIALKREYGIMILLDETYSLGSLGIYGRGIKEHVGVMNANEVDMTFGWAKPVFGAPLMYFCSNDGVVDFLKYRLRHQVVCEGPVSTGVRSALGRVKDNKELVHSLQENTKLFVQQVKKAGFSVQGEGICPVIYVAMEDEYQAGELAALMLQSGIAVAPVIGKNARAGRAYLRFAINGFLSKKQISQIVETLSKAHAKYEKNNPA